jgi:hypothetical protein
MWTGRAQNTDTNPEHTIMETQSTNMNWRFEGPRVAWEPLMKDWHHVKSRTDFCKSQSRAQNTSTEHQSTKTNASRDLRAWRMKLKVKIIGYQLSLIMIIYLYNKYEQCGNTHTNPWDHNNGYGVAMGTKNSHHTCTCETLVAYTAGLPVPMSHSNRDYSGTWQSFWPQPLS